MTRRAPLCERRQSRLTRGVSVEEWEDACSYVITGCLWDGAFAADYQESVTLSIREMRYIANVLRAAQGMGQKEPRMFREPVDAS
jgi:hypothetical protein